MTAPSEPTGFSLPRALLLGLVAGVMAGLFGVGGGVVLVPGLVLLAAMSQHAAHATSLAAIIITAPAALAPFAVEGAVSWPAAAALAAGALIGAVGGADLMKRIPANGLRQLFGAFMLLVAVRMLIPTGADAAAEGAVALGSGVLAGLAATGLLTGLLSALMGVGGGIVMVPIMVVGFGFSQHLAEGTSLAVIIPTAVVGAWRHSRNGYTRWRVGLTVGAGGVVGGLAGGTIAQLLDGAVLQALFGVLLVVTGGRLILRSRRAARAGSTSAAVTDRWTPTADPAPARISPPPSSPSTLAHVRELPTGHRLGAYRIRRVAGRGAVGIVYLAEHVTEKLPVAVKTLSPSYANEPVFRERFSREAQGAAAVEHPNIISVFDVGEQDGLPYLVMTFVDGPDLERVLNERGGRLEPAEAVLICAAVGEALDAAAAHGLAHRDVKPANILLEGWSTGGVASGTRRPHVFLTDFGLIKSSAQARVTQTGQFVGTLLYMAPEQIESRAVPASDQYSLACVLWECLTATFPFEPTGGSALSLLSAHIGSPVPRITERPGDWPRALDDVFLRALGKAPEDRFPTCTAFLDAATRALGLGQAAPAVTPAPPKTAIEHTQIIPTSPPVGRATPPLRAPADADARPLATPRTGATPATPAAPVPGPFGGGSWVGQPDPARSWAGTPAAFPTDLGRGGPGGLQQQPPPAGGPQRSSRGLVLGVVVLLALIAAAVAAVVLLGGDQDEGAATDLRPTEVAFSTAVPPEAQARDELDVRGLDLPPGGRSD